MPKIYLNGATLMTTPTNKVLDVARAAGYSGIEARAERLLEDAAEVRSAAALARRGEVLTLNGVRLSLRDDGRVDREALEADLPPRLRICRELQAPYLLAVPPRAPGMATRAAVPGVREALGLARDRAAEMGIRIAFEFLGFADCPINTAAIAAEVVEGLDGIDLVLDSCHWHASGSERLDDFPVGRLALVHLNDAPDKPPREIEDQDRVLPGEGAIKLAALKGELARRGYTGPWSLETFNPGYWNDDPADIARRGLEALTRLVS